MRRLLLAATFVLAVRVQAQQAYVEENIGPNLLAPERIAALPDGARQKWQAYIATSRRLHSEDSASLALERERAKLTAPVQAPYLAPDFRYGERAPAWFATDSARRLADALLTWQTPSGGWSKRTNMWSARTPGMSYYSETPTWHYSPTFDNGATTGQIRFLGEMALVRGNGDYKKSFLRGLALMLLAQQPNGCWPQSYPLDGGYHDAATFNDDVTVLVMRLLDDVAAAKYPFVPEGDRGRAKRASANSLACLLNAQVIQNGRRTVWGQQHDPLTLEVVRARMYELPGLAGRESATIALYLMSLPSPSADVVAAVHGAAAWFAAHALHGIGYRGYVMTPDPSAPDVWARLTDLETDKPLFANRDGVKLYDWNKLTDRRSGYGWFGTEPAQALAQYREWTQSHPSQEKP